MFTLLVELRCNNYCIFCGQRAADRALVRSRQRLGLAVPRTTFGEGAARYTLATAVDALARARRDGFTELQLQGGEPTVFRDIVALVGRARDLGFRAITLVTNGRRLADAGFARALVGAGLDGLSISLLGPDAATHDALAAVPGAFDALVLGLRHAADAGARLGRTVHVDANLIVSALHLDGLPRSVRLLAGCGVRTATLHLVRFSGLGSDPVVVERLAFDLQRITPVLDAVWDEAARHAVRAHASDVPVCMHPRLVAEELRLVERAKTVAEHRVTAAEYAYPMSRRYETLEACDGCLAATACRCVSREYLPSNPAEVLRPLTPARIAALVDSTLTGLDPSAPSTADRLVDLEESLLLLASIDGRDGILDAPRERLRGALADLVAFSGARRDSTAFLRAGFGWLGLRGPTTTELGPDAWELLAGATSRLAARVHALPDARAPRGPRLVFGDRFAIACAEGVGSGGEVFGERLVPLVAAASDASTRALRAFFLGVVAPRFAGFRHVRVGALAVEAVLDGRWQTLISVARPGAVRIDYGPARVVDGANGST